MSPNHAEPSECSKVHKMLLCDVFAKQLTQGNSTRRHIRENIFNELHRSDADLRRHDTVRSCASDLGRMLVDSGSRSGLPAHLLEAPRDDFDLGSLPAPAASSRLRQSVADRLPTPFRWSDSLAETAAAATPLGRASMRLAEDARWPSPAIGRQFKVPAPSGALIERVPSSRGQSSAGLAVSQSVPMLVLAPKNAKLAATLAKMKKVKSDPAAHLRRCAIQMGVPAQGTTTYMAAATGPIAMAMDPKWSTDLKKIEQRMEKTLKFNSRLSGAGTTISPELRYLPRDFEEGYVPKALPKAV